MPTFMPASPDAFTEADCGHTHAESARAERRLRIGELGLVLGVAFGSPVFANVHPLLGGGRAYGPFADLYAVLHLVLQIALALALLGYLVWRRRVWQPTPTAAATSVAGGRFGWLRQVGWFDWWLVFMVAFWQEFSWWLYGRLRHLDWEPGPLVRNFPCISLSVEMVISLLVLAVILKRSGRSFGDLGLRWSAYGAALALPLLLVQAFSSPLQRPIVYWLGQTLGPLGWHPPDVGAMLHSGGIQIATNVEVLLVGFYEELIVRAYVMTEIIALTHRPWLAIVISVAIQTSYHFYQGVPLALSHITIFLVFALFYAKTRLILPVALAHSLIDLSSTWNYGLQKMFPF